MRSIVEALRSETSVIAAELRPPRAELSAAEGLEAWIDTYHAVHRLTRAGVYVFLTDSAVGRREEDNLRHLVINLGTDAPRARVVPFLTAKHSLEYCLTYAERAWQAGFPALVVLGGDPTVGPPRCVEHAWQLRAAIRARRPELRLGGWANPHRDPAQQVRFLVDDRANADFFLTQIVSHHHLAVVERFLREAERQRLTLPGLFGVFYYRSANPRTLAALSRFLPVPAEPLAREFAAGAAPEDICARTLRALGDLGVRHFYISNLPIARAEGVLGAILERLGVRA